MAECDTILAPISRTCTRTGLESKPQRIYSSQLSIFCTHLIPFGTIQANSTGAAYTPTADAMHEPPTTLAEAVCVPDWLHSCPNSRPPTLLRPSSTTTENLIFSSSRAATNPDTPAPTTTTSTFSRHSTLRAPIPAAAALFAAPIAAGRGP